MLGLIRNERMTFGTQPMKRHSFTLRKAPVAAGLIAAVLVFHLGLLPSGCGQGFSPAEAAGHMKLPDDLQVQLVASEPMIAQPVCIEFDDRGRLWVIQYLQYPNPAGLKRATVDR